jgi:transposase
LIQGEEDPVKLSDLARRKLRGKIPELEKALEGHLTEHHRFMLQLLCKQLAQQEELIAELDRKIEEQTGPFAPEIDRLDAVPGVDRHVAEVVLAEVGTDMNPFPTHQNLVSWAGMCPGNEESAGKRQQSPRCEESRRHFHPRHFHCVPRGNALVRDCRISIIPSATRPSWSPTVVGSV